MSKQNHTKTTKSKGKAKQISTEETFSSKAQAPKKGGRASSYDQLPTVLSSASATLAAAYQPDQTHLDENFAAAPDLICLSHLRWDFVFQRPQHLMSRCAKERRVFFVEEPVFSEAVTSPCLEIRQDKSGVYIVVPQLPSSDNSSSDLTEDVVHTVQRQLINDLLAQQHILNYVLWYYTPMALAWTRHLQPQAVIYDCMDELSAFKGAPQMMRQREASLFNIADLVFTGGQSLFEVKRRQHRSVHLFSSSVDQTHFAQARNVTEDPLDQASIPHPRLGFFGVIDERMDLELLDGLAVARPDWHFVIIGPIVKIDSSQLPKHANIHYLGSKSYTELPTYLAGWDVALLPFARNESTEFISPTKTPEYLAAGKPVVSTSIRDVVRPYGHQNLVRIADTVEDFVAAAEAAMAEDKGSRIRRVDAFLAQNSWDLTWHRMEQLIDAVVAATHHQSSIDAFQRAPTSQLAASPRTEGVAARSSQTAAD